MKKFMNKKMGVKIKKATGLLVTAPKILRGGEIDFLLIGEDGVEYQLKENKKTAQMWNLVETKVQVTGLVLAENHGSCCLKTITYKCIDDFIDYDGLTVNDFEDSFFDVSHFDYAI